MFLVGGYTVQAYYVIVSLGCLHCMVTLKRKNSEAPNCLRFIITWNCIILFNCSSEVNDVSVVSC